MKKSIAYIYNLTNNNINKDFFYNIDIINADIISNNIKKEINNIDNVKDTILKGKR